MVQLKHSLGIILFMTLFLGCEFLEDCGADLAVTTLDITGAIVKGAPIEVICVIKNFITTGCSPSENATARVTSGYSPTEQDRFSDFEEFESFDEPLRDDFDEKDGQMDNMKLKTTRGSGYYAMRVEIINENEVDPSNNAMAISIRVD